MTRLPSSGPRLTIDDDSLFFKLVRVVNLTARPFVETLARQHQISLNEWRVMVVLVSHPGMASHEVAEITGLDKMSVSRALAALEHHGRVQRRADPADARRSLLELNTTGRQLFERLSVMATQREAQLFGGLDREETLQLGRTLDRLAAAVAASAASSEPEQAAAPRARAGRG